MEKKSRILILSTAYLPHIGGSELAIKNITDRINNFEFDPVIKNFASPFSYRLLTKTCQSEKNWTSSKKTNTFHGSRGRSYGASIDYFATG